MPYQSVGDLPVDVMTNQLDLSDWNYNDDSDLSLFIIPDESVDLIKDYYDIMTDRQGIEYWKHLLMQEFNAKSE
jgi:hypothetical protein